MPQGVIDGGTSSDCSTHVKYMLLGSQAFGELSRLTHGSPLGAGLSSGELGIACKPISQIGTLVLKTVSARRPGLPPHLDTAKHVPSPRHNLTGAVSSTSYGDPVREVVILTSQVRVAEARKAKW